MFSSTTFKTSEVGGVVVKGGIQSMVEKIRPLEVEFISSSHIIDEIRYLEP